MKILVTGAKGFIGKNLIATLQNIRDGKDKTTALSPRLRCGHTCGGTEPLLPRL